MQSNSVGNYTSDNKIGQSRSGSPICLSRVRLRTEYWTAQSHTKLQFPRMKRIINYERKGKSCIKRNQGCDWLNQTITLNVIG